MSVEVVARTFTETLSKRLRAIGDDGAVVLHWLGQAGFVISSAGMRILIDPYLSDTLGEKYRGTATRHDRMMPAPVDIDGLGAVDLVLVTHHHTDHMDPGTLAPLAVAHPALKFVVPRASRAEAMRRAGVPQHRLLPMDAGETLGVSAHLTVTAVRAAHETLERDEAGHHRFLGYAVTVPAGGGSGVTLLHSGDTVPYAGQVAEIANLKPDLLLLPVNGRSPELSRRGVPGNLTLDEAVRLTADTGTATMIAHHHGMFAFNTTPIARIDERAADPGAPMRVIAARPGLEVRLRTT